MIRLALAMSIIALSLHCASGQTTHDVPPTSNTLSTLSPKLRVRFDAHHANTWLETLPHRELQQYHLLHGLSRAASCIDRVHCIAETQLTPWNDQSLAGVNAIVIDLVSADKPPFLISEIQSIVRFVENGGGLLVIVDHTNCYFHNHVLAPLFEQLDIQLHSSTACDRKPNTLSDGNGWIAISKFTDHPVTSGLQHIAFQSGGCVDERYGIAHTSPQSWSDFGRIPLYGDSTSLGFYGDFKQQPTEPAGPQSVVAAKTIGEGRIVILGDQNSIGGMFLNYADNRRLWLQSMHWITQQDQKQSNDPNWETTVDAPEPGRSLIWCWEDLHNHAFEFGSDHASGLYHWFGWLNKLADVRGTDRELHLAKVVIVPNEKMLLQSPWRQRAESFLEHPGATLIVLCNENTVSPIPGTVQPSWKHSATSHVENSEQWTGPKNNALIHLYNRSRFENRNFESPEKWPSASTAKLQACIESLLVERGVTLYQPNSNANDWLDELDREDTPAQADPGSPSK